MEEWIKGREVRAIEWITKLEVLERRMNHGIWSFNKKNELWYLKVLKKPNELQQKKFVQREWIIASEIYRKWMNHKIWSYKWTNELIRGKLKILKRIILYEEKVQRMSYEAWSLNATNELMQRKYMHKEWIINEEVYVYGMNHCERSLWDSNE